MSIRIADQFSEPLRLPDRTRRRALWMFAAGALLAGAAAFSDWSRFLAGSLVLFLFLLTLGLGCLFFVTLEYTVNASWSVPFRRIPEIFAILVPVSLLLAWPVVFGIHDLYEWSHAEAVARDPILQKKELYLNVPFYLARFAFFYLVWLAGYHLLVRGSFRQDRTGGDAFAKRASKIGPVFMILFVVSVTFAAVDWVMSLVPHWYSSIFGIYLLVGTMVAGVALTTFIAAVLKLQGRLPDSVGPDHFYNLGALLFALNTAWAYIAFAQFLLIWYANLPQETIWYEMRGRGGWLGVSLVLIVAHFFVPFLALLTRQAKMDLPRLRWVAAWVLATHGLDLYWLVIPSLRSSGPALGWQEIAFPFLAASIVTLVGVWQLARRPVLPIKDSRLEAGLHFHL